MKNITIVGAGLVGSLWAVFMAKRGYNVQVFESRPDIRKADISAGKSINLALSNRGWKALDKVGASERVRRIALPMHARMMHDLQGNLTQQPYGKEGQAIYSTSRGDLNAILLDMAQEHSNVNLHFNMQCVEVNPKSGEAQFVNRETKESMTVKSDLIFGTDGAYSAVRYAGLQKEDRFNFSQHYIPDGYREILLPANTDGTHKLDKSCLHIWPRGRFMLIALPNEDGSFTCTLFMPHEGGENSFDQVNTKEEVDTFFKTTFPDFYALMPDIAAHWENHPLSSLAIMRCYPWHKEKAVLMGDAAHATVPFYGQGMNAGFEDCTVMSELMDAHGEDWEAIFEAYSVLRKPDGDALQDLSLYNYIEMRDLVGDPMFLLRKKIEGKFAALYPDLWMPLYSQVTFSDIRYSVAFERGQKQRGIMDQVMALEGIETKWDTEEIMHFIQSKL